MGISDNATIVPGSIVVDSNHDYAVVPSGNTLVVQTAADKATIVSDGQEVNYTVCFTVWIVLELSSQVVSR